MLHAAEQTVKVIKELEEELVKLKTRQVFTFSTLVLRFTNSDSKQFEGEIKVQNEKDRFNTKTPNSPESIQNEQKSSEGG